VPGLLSFLAYNRFEGEVKGINELQRLAEQQFGPGDYVPPVKWTYWTFRLMIGAGLLMLLAALWATVDVWRDRVGGSARLVRLLPWAIALPYLANSAGWIFTEIGRQPWIVFGLQKTVDAVSPAVTAGEVLTSLVGFTVIYGALMVADVYLLAKYATAGASAVQLHPGPALEAPAGA
ncbi:MAG: cytochrome ubiquinol oxidase subunit I, partial [Vicinamibacterales bacterium]